MWKSREKLENNSAEMYNKLDNKISFRGYYDYENMS